MSPCNRNLAPKKGRRRSNLMRNRTQRTANSMVLVNLNARRPRLSMRVAVTANMDWKTMIISGCLPHNPRRTQAKTYFISLRLSQVLMISKKNSNLTHSMKSQTRRRENVYPLAVYLIQSIKKNTIL